jgi:hypothetical protein
MEQLLALRAANFEWATHIDSIWRDPAFDVPQIHDKIRTELNYRLDRLSGRTTMDSPLGTVILGEAGAGKTHLLSALRKEAFSRRASFVLIDMTDVRDFWDTAQLGFLRALYRPGSTGKEQFREILQHIYEHHLGSGSGLMDVDTLAKIRPPALINQATGLIRSLQNKYPIETMEYQDVLRALVLVNSNDFEIASVGFGWLQGLGIDEEQKFKHGFLHSQLSSAKLLRAIAWLYSLRGPVVLALDQLDAIVAEHDLASGPFSDDPAISARQHVSLSIIEGIANGLMALRDITRRTQIVISCLEPTWAILQKKALSSSTDRFEPALSLTKASSGESAKKMVEARLKAAYQTAKIAPPHPTWPFAERAFASLSLTPRNVLKACDQHIRACLASNTVVELATFGGGPVRDPVVSPNKLEKLDEQLSQYYSAARPERIEPKEDESELDALIEAACTSLVAEHELPPEKEATVDRDFGRTGRIEPLHARIRVIHHDQGDREQHYSFRFLEHPNANAFQSRLNAAMTASGIDRALDFRKLRILRRAGAPGGVKTKELLDRFHASGGVVLSPSNDDLKQMMALASMWGAVDRAELLPWLRERKPASKITILKEATGWLFATPPPPVKTDQRDEPKTTPQTEVETVLEAEPPPPPVVDRVRLPLGQRMVGTANVAQELELSIELLPKHSVILAGAGSGKTVLVRRLVEEAALAGIPSIVLDVANDLARLGDPWPERPESFSDRDAVKADAYFSTSEVLVWTPGRQAGNPIRLDPLPDLTTLLDTGDDYRVALDLARSTLEPLVFGKNNTQRRGRVGLLAAVLDYQARCGAKGLHSLIDILSDLPEEASGGFDNAARSARTMADALREQLQINPLLRTEGPALDPGVLLGDGASGRTRVSVINLMSLPDLEVQQTFVNQLAMTMFAWVKAHPATNRPVRGLFIIDEARDFVPSGRSVASKDSLIRLANQARKYGLGIIVATQAPKSIDHNIVANCTTQFYGQASSPAAIEVIGDQIRQRGGSGNDVAKLGTGRFYFHTEGMSSPAKIQTRLCLSHHPKNPLDDAGILERAKVSRAKL